jgi:hypothetical protein
MGIENEQVLEGPDGGLARTLKDLFAGAAGGVAQVLLGMFGEFFGCWSKELRLSRFCSLYWDSNAGIGSCFGLFASKADIGYLGTMWNDHALTVDRSTVRYVHEVEI